MTLWINKSNFVDKFGTFLLLKQSMLYLFLTALLLKKKEKSTQQLQQFLD